MTVVWVEFELWIGMELFFCSKNAVISVSCFGIFTVRFILGCIGLEKF